MIIFLWNFYHIREKFMDRTERILYVLQLENNTYYIGQTKCLKVRGQHGLV